MTAAVTDTTTEDTYTDSRLNSALKCRFIIKALVLL